jgi:hypothetical protein
MDRMREDAKSQRGRRPLEILPATGLGAAILGQDDPRWRRLDAQPAPAIGLRDSFRGTLVGGAIGDAMGRPNEGLRASESRACCIREHHVWHGDVGGPKGTITDGTQTTMGLAEAILGGSRELRERAEACGSGGAGETGTRRGEAKRGER